MSGQAGPVQPGQPEREPIMDLDRALNVLDHVADPRTGAQAAEVADSVEALRQLTRRARAYVKSPDSQRLVLLASVLQEPIKEPARSEPDAAAVKRWLDEHNMLAITRQAATRLGILNGP